MVDAFLALPSLLSGNKWALVGMNVRLPKYEFADSVTAARASRYRKLNVSNITKGGQNEALHQ
jgi:hypothetical protein